MDVYLFILCTGFGGLMVISLLGLSHHHAVGHGQNTHTNCGHGTAHHPAQVTHHPIVGVKTVKNVRPAVQDGSSAVHMLLALLSPRIMFGVLLGFGAVGVLMQPFAVQWPVFALPVLALLLAVVFECYVVQPLWRLLLGFASAPAQTLDQLVLKEGQAATNFDAAGHGLIAVELDGQMRQLLGTLTTEEHATGWRVRTGDRLFIRAVDAQRNSCTVSHLR